MPAPDLQYVVLKDFSPGIRSNPLQSHPSLIPAPPGVANPNNTFRCRALPFGGLGPMPKRASTAFTFTPAAAAREGEIHVTAFHVAGPIVESLSPAFWVQVYNQAFFPSLTTQHEVYLYLGLESEAVSGAGWKRTLALQRIDTREGTQTTLGTIVCAGAAAIDYYAGTEFISTRNVGDTGVGGARAATDIGTPVVVWCYHVFRPDTENDVYMYPDPTTTATVISNTGLNTSLYAGRLVAHQSRIVSTTRQAWAFDDNDSIQDCGWLSWSKPNESLQEAVANYFEGPYSVGAWASMTASDLIIILTHGGAVLIQGDLNAPTVRHLPAVTSTHGIETSGTVAPIGFVYGTNRQGVHVWSGGGNSKSLSPHLPGDFFFSPSLVKSPISKGQFAFWNEWVMVPYNWAYHIETESWWRIDDPDDVDVAYWAAAPYGAQLYGARGTLQDNVGVPQDVIYVYSPDTLATSYSWESQVIIPESINRIVRVRELTLLADGPGTITVTLTGLEEATSTPIVFTLSDTGPQLISSGDIALDSAGIIVKIEADSESSSPAPLVLELRIGHSTLTRAA